MERLWHWKQTLRWRFGLGIVMFIEFGCGNFRCCALGRYIVVSGRMDIFLNVDDDILGQDEGAYVSVRIGSSG